MTITHDMAGMDGRARRRPGSGGTRRAIAKAVSWQALGLVTSTAIAFALTGSLATGSTFALASSGLGAVLYVLHERVWERLG